ncbi:MAG: 2-C-methyl-D-erythritol 4-phosphate cytidylyltransferase, partial [Pseudohongiella sp.]|nr:2-C-methyl-D-erythritol 4-phosphate cytidylyltransferase [Pseudohongiella sp.]
ISEQSQQNDWVLVHDAVRPCVREQDLRALLDYCGAAGASTSGALLATPVSDTLKRAVADGSVQATVDRNQLWAACTPQMFRVGELLTALNQCAQSGITVTDESSAIESAGGAGGKIQLIPCHKDNIKITYPEDLQLAEWILQARQPSSFLSAGA